MVVARPLAPAEPVAATFDAAAAVYRGFDGDLARP